jgi:methylated-DNA-protein-cysteine methyltransferase related protein
MIHFYKIWTMAKKVILQKDNFFEKVFSIVKQIPSGKVSTYGDIAEYLGGRLSARMVGWAMNSAHSLSTVVPAHRVVNRNGMLTGAMHFATPTLMQELLEQEKIEVKNNTIINFEKHRWQIPKSL